MSIRCAASWPHPRQVSVDPRLARTGRGPEGTRSAYAVPIGGPVSVLFGSAAITGLRIMMLHKVMLCCHGMRTTVTLDPDTETLLRQRMAAEGVPFKQALNDAVRRGLRPSDHASRVETPTARLGTPTVNLDRAIQLASELEDEELLRKIRSSS